MVSLEEKIKEVEEEIRKTPVNKGTEAHLAKLKAKLARLKDELELQREKKKKQAHERGVKKTGDATVVLVGPPSVGKSSLVNLLTNVNTRVGEYAFTTTTIVPGMMEYKHAKIQLLDIPGLIGGAADNRGRGREILSWARMADIFIIMVDISTWTDLESILEELHAAGIRINQSPPKVRITKKDKGAITLIKNERQTHMDDELIKAVLREYKIINAEVILEEDITPERLIDAISRNRIYPKALFVVNKIDSVSREKLSEIKSCIEKIVPPDKLCFISVKENRGIDVLKEKIYNMCEFMRVYTKKPGKKPNLSEPMIIKRNATVRDVCERISNELVSNFKYARVYGSSVKFDGQKVGLEHVLCDKDIVEIHTTTI